MPSPSTRWRRFSNSAFALRGPTSSARRSYSGPTRLRSAVLRLIRVLITAAATATMTRTTTIKIMMPADTVTSMTFCLPLSTARGGRTQTRPAQTSRASAMPAPPAFPRTITFRKARWDVGDGDGARGAGGARFARPAGHALDGPFDRRVDRGRARRLRRSRPARRPDLGRGGPAGGPAGGRHGNRAGNQPGDPRVLRRGRLVLRHRGGRRPADRDTRLPLRGRSARRGGPGGGGGGAHHRRDRGCADHAVA